MPPKTNNQSLKCLKISIFFFTFMIKRFDFDIYIFFKFYNKMRERFISSCLVSIAPWCVKFVIYSGQTLAIKNHSNMLSFLMAYKFSLQIFELPKTSKSCFIFTVWFKMKPISLHGHEKSITQIKYNRDGDLLFSCAKDRQPNVWYSINGERLGTYDGHGGAVWCLDVDWQTKNFLSGAADNSVRWAKVHFSKPL